MYIYKGIHIARHGRMYIKIYTCRVMHKEMFRDRHKDIHSDILTYRDMSRDT